MTSRTPDFRVTLDERDLTAILRPRLISLNLTECRSDEADQLDIVLDDTDGKLAIPPKGAKIHLHIGWRGIGNDLGLVDKGSFTVDEVEHSGAPDIITLRARTANLIDTFRQLEEHSFHDTTLGAIIEVIAFRQELKAGIADALRNVAVKHIDQTRESDAAFLRRLGKKYDAITTVKNDTLLFVPINQHSNVTGTALPVVQIIRSLGDNHRYHSAERDSYSGVRAFWYDQRYARRRSVIVGIAGNSKSLKTTFAHEADARTTAIAEWQRIQRGVSTFALQVALGDPRLIPQSPIITRGFKSQIDATDWLIVKINSSISSSGYSQQIELEMKMEQEEAEREIEKDPDASITGVSAAWRDKATQKSGQVQAGSNSNLQHIARVYASRQSAQRAVNGKWHDMQVVREIIRENSDNV